MLEITSNKSVITTFNICIYDSWSVENDQLIVEINGKKYFCMSAIVAKDWNSDISEWQFENVKNPMGQASFVSVLKNGKAGNSYRNELFRNPNSFNGVFAHLFAAYDKEFAKVQSEQLVEAN